MQKFIIFSKVIPCSLLCSKLYEVRERVLQFVVGKFTDEITKILRVMLRIFSVFPVKKNRVIFNSRAGTQYSCNPKCIYEYISKDKINPFELIWVFNEPAKFKFLKNKGAKLCKRHSIRHYYYWLTARVIITNEYGDGEIPKRRGQIKINTWHGGGGGYKNMKQAWKRRARIRYDLEDTDIFCASSETSLKNTVRNAFNHMGEYFPGTPRNDIFFYPASDELKQLVYEFSGITVDKRLLLYAPTYRSKNKGKLDSTINYEALHNAIEEKFGGEWVIAVRMHSCIKEYELPKLDYVIDISHYLDMQDLLCICDMMITDYSSSLWDYSFTNRPCFLYCFDLDEYTINEGFNKSIYEWGFPVAKNMSELIKCIYEFDMDEHKKNMDNQHIVNGSFEDGKSTERLCSLIYKWCFG